MTQIIELKTNRLQLRQWKSSDHDAFYAMSSDPQVMEYFPNVLSRAESDAIANKCQSLIADNGWGVWAVELSETKEFIGMIGLYQPSSELPYSPCIEILWRLARPHWGNGYASEAAEVVLKFGFEVLELKEILSFTVVNNHASRRVMERINMRDTGETFQHPDLPLSSHLSEHCLYKISHEMWTKT